MTALRVGLACLAALGLFLAGHFFYWGVPHLDRGIADPSHPSSGQGDVKRGEYVLRLAGCVACHSDGDDGAAGHLSGGPGIETEYGTFFGPNITQDEAVGIGGWTLEEFVDAVTNGVAPDGTHYYPAFPYTFYASMSDQDLVDLWAYLRSVPPADKPSRPHDLAWPFNVRLLMAPWKTLFFTPGGRAEDLTRDELWNRGAYIVEGPGHCGACHSPRGPLGNFVSSAPLTGSVFGPEREAVPAIDAAGLRDAALTEDDVFWVLQMGLLPDGDVVGSAMAEVVEESTGHLEDRDLRAIANYLANP